MSGTTLALTVPAVRAGHRGDGFWPVAYAFAVMMAFSAAPTPLSVLYQQRDGFGLSTATVVFASYGVGVVLGVFTAGHVSDWLGRRRVLRWALIAAMAAGVLFLMPGLGSLLAGRILSGAGVGLLTATATAYLMELHLARHPGTDRRRAAMAATIANVGGAGLGPLISGVLAEYAPGPLVVPYLVFELLLALAVAGTFLAPETVAPRAFRWRPQRASVPPGHGNRYAAAGMIAFTSVAVFGLFTSLTPGILRRALDQHSLAVAGVVTFGVFAAGVAGQLTMARHSQAVQLRTGSGVLIAGLGALVAGVWLPSVGVFLAGGLLSGAGAGVALQGAVATAAALAAPGLRGESLAGLFLVGYLGLTVPVLGLGLAAQRLDIRMSVLNVAVSLAVLLVVAVLQLRKPTSENQE
ncbi:MFS family permease [Actinoplanes lutulentus]|uniref:Putative MFS family arabinose efflux permease n=1 Tax=Actinoplanes lutulentus TaxID=1287878 RepID=A0A327ZJ66_9ACTN|nr:MFS transporter [Actinoplanes lutulentus]MBB2940559.1 MFS family permease [Actinoplanes lutulentus]RAK42872.1 putative MFS family arabinose efflux permease [Actinoplanes lutulentus]